MIRIMNALACGVRLHSEHTVPATTDSDSRTVSAIMDDMRSYTVNRKTKVKRPSRTAHVRRPPAVQRVRCIR